MKEAKVGNGFTPRQASNGNDDILVNIYRNHKLSISCFGGAEAVTVS